MSDSFQIKLNDSYYPHGIFKLPHEKRRNVYISTSVTSILALFYNEAGGRKPQTILFFPRTEV